MHTEPNIVFAHGTYEIDASHVPMLSKPSFVLDVIRDAAKAVANRGSKRA